MRENLREFWNRCAGPIVLLVCVIITTALCLCAVRAQEVPDGIIRGLVAVESGAEWRGIGDINGNWKRGKAGEISHFQLSSSALKEMGAAQKAARICACPILAESYARKWLSLCYEKRGNWRDALASYNAGSGYRSARAQDYASRILNLSQTQGNP